MKNRVVIFDTTLRDGEQPCRPACRCNRKSASRGSSPALQVDVIEAGFPISSPGDFESVETIAREIKGPAICGLARAVEKDILTCAKALSPRTPPHPYLHRHLDHPPGKKLHRTPEEILALVTQSVKLARSKCDDVQFSAEDAGRTEPEFLCVWWRPPSSAAPAPSTFPTPWAIPRRNLRGHHRQPDEQRAQRGQGHHRRPLSQRSGHGHGHSITAVKHGGAPVECTINGIGERAGNAALEEVVMIMKVRKDYLNVTCNVPPPRSCAPAAWCATCVACRCSPTKRWWAATLRALVGHPSGRRAQGQADL